jgi:hypothetical protein
METDIEHYADETQLRSFSIEGRYAFADWNKIPLNPTIFAEYKVGGGRILHDEGAPTPGHKFGPGGFDTSMENPDAYEVRLLLSQDFFDRIEWALNGFFEQELEGDRGREWGIAQSVVTPFWLAHEELKGGIECLFRSFSDKGTRGTPYNSFVIGPTIAWRPSRNTRLDVSPLFGVNHKSPEVQFFAVLSYYFGGGSSNAEGGEAPASTRNR